ncbi:hypothetical protein IQ07DRAFT_31498 [Pyrenochaeta sp. DS3sAY3a]|nr:hypothetical protein IQ07DRAFT_31498 [Pyrenochaeta sp. DS3sAY3a]
MPTHTPSPHRFLAPNPPATQKSKAKPQSGLRHALPEQTPKPKESKRQHAEPQFKKITPAKRFVITPARHALNHAATFGEPAANGEREGRNGADMPMETTPRPKPRRTFERVESIEEASQSSPTAPDDDPNITQSIEPFLLFENEESTQYIGNQADEMLYDFSGSTKRRRVSTPSPPPTPTTAHNSTSHRFKVPAPRTPAFLTSKDRQEPPTAQMTPAPAQHRPAFLLPSLPTSPPKPSKPLPEIFSPSRKSGKYIPAGLASTMTSWIIETAGSGYAGSARTEGVVWGREREDGVRLRFRVRAVSAGTALEEDDEVGGDGEEGEMESEVECFPGAITFVCGDTEPGMYNASRTLGGAADSERQRLLLAGQGGARGVSGIRVRAGSILGIRTPMWDVDLAGEKWTVGVDWSVL